MEVEVVMELILQKKNTSLSGLFFVGLFAVSAQYIASHPFLRELGISPLIIGILLGTVYGNTLRHELPTHWVSGIVFSTKTLLRLGIVLYGFRVTLQDIFAVGPAGFSVSLIIVTWVAILGVHWPDDYASLAELWKGYAVTDNGFGNFRIPLLFLVMLLPLVLKGPGKLSVDHLLAKRFK